MTRGLLLELLVRRDDDVMATDAEEDDDVMATDAEVQAHQSGYLHFSSTPATQPPRAKGGAVRTTEVEL